MRRLLRLLWIRLNLMALRLRLWWWTSALAHLEAACTGSITLRTLVILWCADRKVRGLPDDDAPSLTHQQDGR